MTRKKEESEFGKGLTYCLGMFVAHQFQFQETRETMRDEGKGSFWASMWFSGASDHLYELQTEYAPKHLRKRVKAFRSKCLGWRGLTPDKQPSAKDVHWSLEEAKELLRLIDKYHKVPTCKAGWT